MSFFCLRVDLDYVPWDSPDARDFGHGEPAAILRLLDLARELGYRIHFFASNRAIRAFPAAAEAALGEGHDLDWFCKRPDEAESRFREAEDLFGDLGVTIQGMCLRSAWPDEELIPSMKGKILFISSPLPCRVKDVVHFPVETRSDREAIRGGMSIRAWTDASKAAIRDASARNRGLTVAVRPQVLAKFDVKLSHLREVIEMARAVELPNRTLRQLV